MTKRHVADRRERNRQLAIEDARRRCALCKRAIPKDAGFSVFSEPDRYCSVDCLEAARERRALEDAVHADGV